MTMYTISDVMQQVYANQTLVVSLAFATYAFGFVQYLTSIYMQVKNKHCPFYFWQHCWYFGHDLTFSLLFHQWFVKIGFWLFEVLCIGCMCFVVIELCSLYMVVKNERQETWGQFYSGKVTEKSAWLRGISGYVIGFALFMIIRIAIGDPMCLVLMMSTNAILAIFAQFRLEEVGKREKGINVLSWATLFGTILTFCPPKYGFFATCVTALNAPWFYVLGAMCIICAVRFLVKSYQLPRAWAEFVIS